MQLIPVERLKPHPKNPRLVMREDVIDTIKANLSGGFHESYALQVWPDGDSYTILSGHHRAEAAKRAGITEVPCWVRDDIDEEAAYMVLATANAQGELAPLEIGFHALHYVEKAGGGAKDKGKGLKAYAEKMNRNQGDLTTYRQAATVASKLFERSNSFTPSDLLKKAAQLAAIHKLPESCWGDCVKYMLDKDLSARDVQDLAKSSSTAATPKRCTALFTGKTSIRELERIDELVNRVAATLDDDSLQSEWLEWAEAEDPVCVKVLQAKRIEFEDRAEQMREKEPESELPNLVLADPPWKYDFSETDSRQIENQYPSATPDEIIAMRPNTAPDCILLLWATVAKLREALDVMSGWGFEYKTHAVWDKEKIGMGYWFRGQHELLLVGTKGQASPPEQSYRVSSVFREARGAHSAKPECVYQWIESAFASHTKLEMFCRSSRAGWKVFGNESKK